MLSRLVAAMSRQMSDGAGCQPGRVAQAAAGQRESVVARAFTHHVHQRACHELRQMADVGHGGIVRFRGHHVHRARDRR